MGGVRELITFLGSINPKMNVLEGLEFKLAYFSATDQQLCGLLPSIYRRILVRKLLSGFSNNHMISSD